MTSDKPARKSRAKTPAAPPAPQPSVKAAKAVKAVGAASPAPSVKPAPTAVESAAPAAKKGPAPEKARQKLVRDSFTIPKKEYLVIEALKLRIAALGRMTKKSELLRAGIKALDAMSDKALLAALSEVPSLKTGRPKSSAKPAD